MLSPKDVHKGQERDIPYFVHIISSDSHTKIRNRISITTLHHNTAEMTKIQTPMKSSSAPLRWGIIGCGDVCEIKSGPAFYKCENSSLVAVMRRDEKKAQDYAQRHNVEKFYSNIDDIINDDDVDCLYVATPPGGDRTLIASKIAHAGKPCYMEKPLARDHSESQEIVECFERLGIPLYVAFYRRYMPKFVAVKEEVLECSLLGDLTGVSVTLSWPRHREEKKHWHYKKEISGGGLLLDVGCHMLDIVDHLVGPILDCQGIAIQSVKEQGWIPSNGKVEDNVRGFWKHKIGQNKVIGGNCSFNFCSGGQSQDEVKIIGTKGTVIFSCFNSEPAKVVLEGEREIIILGAPHPDHVHQPLVQMIVNELLTTRSTSDDGKLWSKYLPPESDRCTCTGVAGSRTSKVMDQLLNNRQSWKEDYV